jgi:hypothetical protein
MLMLARIVRIVTALVVGVIVVGIVLHLLDANAGNALVGAIYDVAGWLVTPFKGLFSLDEQKAQIAVNWGIAALVYAIVGGVIASLLARAALRSRGGYGRRPGAVV